MTKDWYYRMESVRDLVIERGYEVSQPSAHKPVVPPKTWVKRHPCEEEESCTKSCNGYVLVTVVFGKDSREFIPLEILFLNKTQEAYIRRDNPKMKRLVEVGNLQSELEASMVELPALRFPGW